MRTTFREERLGSSRTAVVTTSSGKCKKVLTLYSEGRVFQGGVSQGPADAPAIFVSSVVAPERLAPEGRATGLFAGGEQVEVGTLGLGLGGKIVLFAEAAVDAAGDQGGGGADDLAGAAAEENGYRDLGMGFVSIGDEPADARSGIAAGSGLAQGHFVSASIEATLAGAVENRREHAFANFRKHGGDIQVALDARSKALDFISAARVLQIVERAAVRESSGERNQLERRDLNAFAIAGHTRDAATGGGLHGEGTRMLLGQIVAGKLAEAEEARVSGNGVEAHAAAQLFEKDVVGMGHGFGQIHVLAAADLEHGVAGDDIFFERGKRDGGLDGGARNVAVTESNFLIDDGEDAAGVGIHGDNSTVVAAQGVDRGGAHDGIVKGSNVRERGIGEGRDAAKTRDVMQRSSAPGSGGRQRRSDRYSKNCGQENTTQWLHRFTPKIFLLDSAGWRGCFYPSFAAWVNPHSNKSFLLYLATFAGTHSSRCALLQRVGQRTGRSFDAT